MTLERSIAGAALCAMLFASGASIASAETTPAAATSTVAVSGTVDVAALMAKVEELKKQIEEMKAKIAVQQTEIKALHEKLKLEMPLRLGAEGDQVKLLQEALATDPSIYPEGKVTGYFGKLTAEAVKRFQEKAGLEKVGNVGPKTMEILNKFFEEGGAGRSGVIPPGLLRPLGTMIGAALEPQHDSGVRGIVKITENAEGKAVVRVETISDPRLFMSALMPKASGTMPVVLAKYPAHIRVGACPKPGEVKYPLAPVENGRSETVLSVSLRDLTAGLPLAVTMHKSAEDQTLVVCGDLKAPPAHVWTATTSWRNVAIPKPVPPPWKGEYPKVVLLARAALAEKLGVAPEKIKVDSVTETVWSNSCLGANKPEEICLMVTTKGYKVVLVHEGKKYVYHTNRETVFRLIEEAPVPPKACMPRPACLDATPACLPAEPMEGWCPPKPVACTEDAKQCPDGSWVGRTGSNCEFVCPAASTTPR